MIRINGKSCISKNSIIRFMAALIIATLLGWPAMGSAGTTVIQVNTDHGGNIDWGGPAAWDGSYENVNGALFWNGSGWICNDTYGHMYFIDLRTGERIGHYCDPEYNFNFNSVGNWTIGGYDIIGEEYSYSIGAKDGGTYTYTGLRYRTHQPDGTDIWAYSRGNGNGTANACGR